MNRHAHERGMVRRNFVAGLLAAAIASSPAIASAQAANAAFDGVWAGEVRTPQAAVAVELTISDAASGTPKIDVKAATGDGRYDGKASGNKLTYASARGTSYLTLVDERNIDFTYVTNNGHEVKGNITKK